VSIDDLQRLPWTNWHSHIGSQHLDDLYRFYILVVNINKILFNVFSKKYLTKKYSDITIKVSKIDFKSLLLVLHHHIDLISSQTPSPKLYTLITRSLGI